jgi:hypothetical protein
MELRGSRNLFSHCQGSYSGCGEERHQGALLIARVEHARLYGVNWAVDDGAKTPPAKMKRVPAPSWAMHFRAGTGRLSRERRRRQSQVGRPTVRAKRKAIRLSRARTAGRKGIWSPPG